MGRTDGLTDWRTDGQGGDYMLPRNFSGSIIKVLNMYTFSNKCGKKNFFKTLKIISNCIHFTMWPIKQLPDPTCLFGEPRSQFYCHLLSLKIMLTFEIKIHLNYMSNVLLHLKSFLYIFIEKGKTNKFKPYWFRYQSKTLTNKKLMNLKTHIITQINRGTCNSSSL